MTTTLPATEVARLRSALVDAEFTVAGVEQLIGAAAHRALGRNETTPALRRTTGGSVLATLTRLWPLQAPVTAIAAERALPGLVDPMCGAGILERSVDEVRARIDLRPYADEQHDWWVASDLTPGLDGGDRQMRGDHVLGVSSASNSLAQLTIREPVGSALDLGTGGGVQALHLSRHARRVVATDINPRCLRLAALTAGVNDVNVDLRLGSLFEPVQNASFDLIVTNPPFVISPGAGERLAYRDSGLPGDELVRTLLTESAEHLNDGGWCQLLANWLHPADQSWSERLAGWIAPTGCDAWVVQREVTDVARYVELWLDDAGLRGTPGYVDKYDAWLGWFADRGVEAVGFGWAVLRRAGRDVPHVTIEDWPYDVEQPLGPTVADWGRRVDALSHADDETILGSRLVCADDVVEERHGGPGEVDPARIILRRQRGMRRAEGISTAVAAFVGACDGELTVAQIAGALANLLDREASSMREELVDASRNLILGGYLSVPEAATLSAGGC